METRIISIKIQHPNRNHSNCIRIFVHIHLNSVQKWTKISSDIEMNSNDKCPKYCGGVGKREVKQWNTTKHSLKIVFNANCLFFVYKLYVCVFALRSLSVVFSCVPVTFFSFSFYAIAFLLLVFTLILILFQLDFKESF